MSDLSPLRRRAAPALAPGHHGRPGPVGLSLAQLDFDGCWEIAGLGGGPETRAAVAALIGFEPPGPGAALRREPVEAIRIGPARWAVLAHAGALSAAAAPPPCLAVTDVSAARALLLLSGPKARETLAKGTSIDLHESAFGEGACAATRLGHIAVTLWRPMEGDGFRLLVARSYAQALADWLLLAGREYGVRVG